MKKIDSKNLINKITIQTESPKTKQEKNVQTDEPQVPKKKKKFFASPPKKIVPKK